TAAEVEFQLIDVSSSNDLENGFGFLFVDGSESPTLTCSIFRTKTSCKEGTSHSSVARSVYETLQHKKISKIKIDKNSYEIEPNVADQTLTLFSCISP